MELSTLEVNEDERRRSVGRTRSSSLEISIRIDDQHDDDDDERQRRRGANVSSNSGINNSANTTSSDGNVVGSSSSSNGNNGNRGGGEERSRRERMDLVGSASVPVTDETVAKVQRLLKDIRNSNILGFVSSVPIILIISLVFLIARVSAPCQSWTCVDCNTPLPLWALILLLTQVMMIPLRVRIHRTIPVVSSVTTPTEAIERLNALTNSVVYNGVRLLRLFVTVWFIVGMVWAKESAASCSPSPLYYLCLILILLFLTAVGLAVLHAAVVFILARIATSASISSSSPSSSSPNSPPGSPSVNNNNNNGNDINNNVGHVNSGVSLGDSVSQSGSRRWLSWLWRGGGGGIGGNRYAFRRRNSNEVNNNNNSNNSNNNSGNNNSNGGATNSAGGAAGGNNGNNNAAANNNNNNNNALGVLNVIGGGGGGGGGGAGPVGGAAAASAPVLERERDRVAGVVASVFHRGMSKKAIESLPNWGFEDGRLNPDNALCAICLADYIPGERIRNLVSCPHHFHMTCIDRWLASKKLCPLCQTPVKKIPKVKKEKKKKRSSSGSASRHSSAAAAAGSNNNNNNNPSIHSVEESDDDRSTTNSSVAATVASYVSGSNNNNGTNSNNNNNDSIATSRAASVRDITESARTSLSIDRGNPSQGGGAAAYGLEELESHFTYNNRSNNNNSIARSNDVSISSSNLNFEFNSSEVVTIPMTNNNNSSSQMTRSVTQLGGSLMFSSAPPSATAAAAAVGGIETMMRKMDDSSNSNNRARMGMSTPRLEVAEDDDEHFGEGDEDFDKDDGCLTRRIPEEEDDERRASGSSINEFC